MVHKITEIDVDGVLPKKIISSHPDKREIAYWNGYNESASSLSSVGVCLDVEELAKDLWLNFETAKIGEGFYKNWLTINEEYRKYWREKAKAIAANPKVVRVVKI